jgi:hypothetical protein
MKRLAFLYVIAFVVVSAQAVVIFEDDFEDGTLNKWTIDGRQQGVNVAEVVTKNSTQMAHFYHKNFSEITMSKRFDYDPALTFSFDMEVVPHSDASSTSSHYTCGNASFVFFDSSNTELGIVLYTCTTSSYPFVIGGAVPYWWGFPIPQGAGVVSYNLNIQNLLSNITIDVGSISYVNLGFAAYASTDSYNSYTNMWVDNVVVTPEPATLLLLAAGSLAVLRKKSR